MTTRVVHFEIPIDDADRASAFYRDVFGWKVNQWGSSDYWTMEAGEDAANGSDGALKPRGEESEGVTIYMSVDNIDQTMEKVKEVGGTLLTEKMPVPTMGYSAHFRDTEGNLIGLFQSDPSAQMPDVPTG